MIVNITSYAEEPGVPTSTVMKHRFKKGGKWEYDADLDSGEQEGSKDIPPKVASVLRAFGLRA